MVNKKISLIIMSAGESTRFRKKCKVKKHWLRINGKPLWLHVADLFRARYAFCDIIITASFRDCAYMRKFCDFNIVCGGETRQDSLKNALQFVKSEFVMVSDAARFDLDFAVIDELLNYDMKQIDCLIPVLSVNDTIFINEDSELKYLNRDLVKLVQTPQISRVSVLKEALNLGNFSDESSAIKNFGGKVEYINGSEKLRKLTHFKDLHFFANRFDKNDEIRVGYGFDVHRFKTESSDKNSIFLCGVEIKSAKTLEAHSDGDVALHALCDAMLGAIGAGDIGEWFPPDDKKYENIDSKVLLKEVSDFIVSVGYKIANIDIMIMAQQPKILPYKEKMTNLVSEILDLNKQQINIKATTMENLGFVGRNEGICVSANVLVKHYDLGVLE